MVIGLHGIPGSGKNVVATHYALKKFKKDNFILFRAIRTILHQPSIYNAVYSTYPIRLKHYSKWRKKQDIYSRRVTIYDLVPSNRFLANSLIIIDETQAFWDSEDYREFPKEIAVFNQFHRHFDIDNIYYITQHPSRLLKKLCVLCSEFDKVKTFIKFPLIPIGFVHIVQYFERDDYGKYNHPKREAKTYDVRNKYFLFITSKVFKAYKSKYLQVLNCFQPLYDRGCFDDLYLTDKEIRYIYKDNI